MQELRIFFMTSNDGFEIGLHPITDESADLFNSLMQCFGEVVDGVLNIKAEQQASKDIKSKIQAFTDNFAPRFPHLNKLNKKISDLKEDEYFLVLRGLPQDTKIKHQLEVYLNFINEKKGQEFTADDFQAELEQSGDFLSDLLHNYNIDQPRTDRKTIIGNKKKSDRICRFCGKGLKDGVTFSKVAHAISEGLGNKNIILADECDSCNEYFGNEIEPQLITHLDIYRAFLGIKGKNGLPTITYKNAIITHQDDVPTLITQDIEKISDEEFIVTLHTKNKFNPLKLYKALVKISLSTINSNSIHDFKTTFEWLTSPDITPVELPKIARSVIHSGFSKHPEITNYIRKSDDQTLPHLFSEFRIGSFVYVFIVPFSEKDNLKFVAPNEFEAFWNRLEHYAAVKNWRFDRIDSASDITITEKIHIKKSTK
ncbi:hypothetical protein B723_12385 [Pseudomonas fluorescens NCIMB 11764]|uniref:HNH endonuclease 5 domain-containing protein n=1 Tax=Pseudomonas fluorescens NCIMB 11764 TaxID=1221522 RepID=A0A0K1QNC4_PSEFL|nr:HNH endonuclease [Pseudomonas fluorescens]AKV07167.1 hypothetical protein B723_12385 [Pseudomonas fluorescens NCIMB 11764]